MTRSSPRSNASHNWSGESMPPGSRHAMPMTATGVTCASSTAGSPLLPPSSRRHRHISISGPRMPQRRTNSLPPHPDRPLNSEVISSVVRRLDACKKIVRTYQKIYGAMPTLGEADQGEHHQLSVVSNALGPPTAYPNAVGLRHPDCSATRADACWSTGRLHCVRLRLAIGLRAQRYQSHAPICSR